MNRTNIQVKGSPGANPTVLYFSTSEGIIRTDHSGPFAYLYWIWDTSRVTGLSCGVAMYHGWRDYLAGIHWPGWNSGYWIEGHSGQPFGYLAGGLSEWSWYDELPVTDFVCLHESVNGVS